MSRNSRVTKRKVKVAHLNFVEHRKVISRYITTKAMYESYAVKFNESPTIIKVLSLYQNLGTKELDIDLKAYEKLRRSAEKAVSRKLNEIFKIGKSCLPTYLEYIKYLNSQSRHYSNAMKDIRAEIMKYNQSEVNTAALFGKAYSGLKLAADLTNDLVISNSGAVGAAYGYLYTVATETASSVADAKNANLWTFKGSLSAPYVMALDEIGKDVIKSSAKLKTARTTADIVKNLLDFKANIEPF